MQSHGHRARATQGARLRPVHSKGSVALPVAVASAHASRAWRSSSQAAGKPTPRLAAT
jgi:hypothetical protein